MTSPVQLLDALVRDARFALRVLRKSPVFTTTAVLTLAVGIGANAAIFGVVDSVLLRRLPYPEPERLALVATEYRSDEMELDTLSQTGLTWETLRDHARTMELAVFSDWTSGVNLFAGDRALNVEEQRVGARFFDVLGVRPAVGRSFTREEDVPGGPAVAVLSHGLWSRVFGADRGIVGRPILLKGEPHTVLGVMPEGFRSTTPADLWTPLRPSTSGEGGGTNYGILARLAPGTSWEQATAEVAALGGAAWEDQAWGPDVSASFALDPFRSAFVQGKRDRLLLLWLAAGLVLLVVCANLASLMLARASRRRSEIGARLALGSGRAPVVRQLLVESVVLAAAGGLLGVALGRLALPGLAALARDALGVWQPVALDARVLLATALLALAASVAFGLGPALQASRLDLREVLVEGGSRGAAGASSHWPRRFLVVAEVAIGVVLVVFAGLLVRTFVNLKTLDPGFEPDGLVAGTVSLQDARYETREAIDRLLDESLERIRALPGVESAAVALGLPYQRPLNLGSQVTRPDGSQTEPTAVSAAYVTPGYFETLEIPLLRGRRLEETDGPEAPPVAVVNRAFVKRFVGEQSALESRVSVAGEERAIVGVVGDVLHDPSGVGGTFDPVARIPMVYLASDQVASEAFVLVHTWFQPSWVVRSALPTEAVVAGLRQAMREVDPRLPFAAFQEMEEVEARIFAEQRFLMTQVAGLALVAVVLVALGIWGLVAHSVVERTRELGIRLALGSTFGQAIRAVALPCLALTGVGVALGVGLALASSRLVEHLVWGVRAGDPWTLAGAALLLLVVGAAAGVGPGLQVLRLDPARTLREE